MPDFKKPPSVNSVPVALLDHLHPTRGLALWLDASRIPNLSDGDAVATWPDRSGKGRDATQATGGSQPTWQANEINGWPVVRADGTDDFLATAAVAGLDLTAFSFFMAAKIPATATGFRGIFGKVNASFTGGWELGLSTELICTVRGTSTISGSSGFVDVRDGVARIYSGTAYRSGVGQYRNGALAETTLGTWSPTAATAAGFTVFARELTGGGGSQYAPMDLAELLIVDGVLSTVDRCKVEDYLAGKYGVTVAQATVLDPPTFATTTKWGTD